MKFGRFLLAAARPLYFLLFPYRVSGRENIPSADGRPLVLCANHISNLDPVFLLMAFKKRPIHYMAKAELFRGRLAAWFFGKQFGAFPVHRGKGDSGALETAERIVRQGKLLGIFPEGTRSKDGKLGRAKSGAALIAARAGAAVLPVAIAAPAQKVRMFRRTRVIIGRPLTPAELRLDDAERPDLRFASRAIMERIAGLMEEAP